MRFNWRELQIIKAALEYYAEHGGGIDYPDDDQTEEEMSEIEDLAGHVAQAMEEGE